MLSFENFLKLIPANGQKADHLPMVMPGPMAKVFFTFSRVILARILWGGGYYPHVTDEQTEAQTLKQPDLPE